MAQIEYTFPVEKIHGKISKKHRIGFAHRTASNLNYSVMYGHRTTKPSALEAQHRIKFAAVHSAVLARKEDPTKVAADQANYAKVKDQYNSLYHYIFRQEWEAYQG